MTSIKYIQLRFVSICEHSRKILLARSISWAMFDLWVIRMSMARHGVGGNSISGKCWTSDDAMRFNQRKVLCDIVVMDFGT
jgi:hypothetical protein